MGIFEWVLLIWLIAIVVTIRRVVQDKWHEKAKLFLYWSLFPFPLILHPKRFGVIKSLLLFVFSPCTIFFSLVCLVLIAMSYSAEGIPAEIPYRSASDLRRITGADFPEVVPVDSFYEDNWNWNEVSIKFVPKKPLRKKFFQSLDKACTLDSCCWRKDSTGYHYFIYPERPIDRTKGTHIRQVEVNGEMVNDWDGDFVSVYVPFKGDTIYVSDGWSR